MNYLKKGLIFIGAVSIVIGALLYFGIMWRSPAYYKVKEEKDFVAPIMSMQEYAIKGHHRRPYIYQIASGKGGVYILGIEHTKDDNDPQIDSISTIWEKYQPNIALVEGRLGFLFSWFQNPVKNHGEGGETVRLAKKYNTPFYTWEPEKNTEVQMLLKKYSPKKVAFFYSLRPYFSNYRFGKPSNPDEMINEYIKTRTDFDGIRGQISNVAEVDSIWKKEFSNLKDWRDTSDEFGWPEGYLADIAAQSNQIRDIHLCSIIIEEVNKGNKVFATMGSSHAFRIEQTLREALKNK